ncbi:MAG: hypothetical protein ABSE39_11730 [Candidatus Bathyarchaeia archaeon]
MSGLAGFARKAVPLVLLAAVIILTIAQPSHSQVADVSTLSYQTFNQLASVYRSGGTAPGLVSRLNVALGLIENARIKRAQGDTANAVRLEDQARSIIEQLSPETIAAQQQAVHDSTLRAQVAYGEAALVVALLTFCFYAGLRLWRWYEKERLYEMRILAEKTEN